MTERVNKGAILVINGKGETVKWFKTWHWSPDRARIEIKYKDKNGKKLIIKKYSGSDGRVALVKCLKAVRKYWPRYNPARHAMLMTSGHCHKIKNKKR